MITRNTLRGFVPSLLVGLLAASTCSAAEKALGKHPAPAPLFRDPIHDGAADPTLVWNRAEKCWWMLYTNRRADADTAAKVPALPLFLAMRWLRMRRRGEVPVDVY